MKQLGNTGINSEIGSAGVKLLIAAIVFGLIGYGFVNYIPIAYQGESFKQDMETAIIQGISMPTTHGKPAGIVKQKLETAIRVNELPADTYLDVKQKGNVVTARVYYKKNVSLVPFGIYDYEYVFDVSSTPSGFLSQ